MSSTLLLLAKIDYARIDYRLYIFILPDKINFVRQGPDAAVCTGDSEAERGWEEDMLASE